MRVVGIGVDVVEIDRVRKILEERPTFRHRVFTGSEIEDCERSARPAECYASRWAAREACVKALGGTEGARWQDIRVEEDVAGAPRIVLDGKAKVRAEELGVTEVLVSLAHERSVATAFCVAVAP
jgi:holo-[acyl-carrier protein] synthase